MGIVDAVRFQGYKSFSNAEAQELSILPAVSVLIGKNNSGKSSCLDALECIFLEKEYFRVKQNYSKVSASFLLEESDISHAFNQHYSGGDINGNHFSYGQKFVGKRVYEDLSTKISGRDIYLELKLSDYQPDLELPIGKKEWEAIARPLSTYQDMYGFRRINADRDVLPEEESLTTAVSYNGAGATNILRKFINHSAYDEKIVEEILLRELNKIMLPDAFYENIRIQQIEDKDLLKWEVFLEEKDGRRFALSKSGSGLKTIILMLINLYVIPELKEYKGKQLIYAFEELENNLHPALQRKVFEYLYDYAINKKVHIFITTHSHIAINTYFEKDDVAIYHVQKKDKVSSLTPVKDRETRLDVLSDLDVRASDLFQANGIIWVEGPSDRVYINHWLKIFCDSKFIEGAHYQFLYYGGKTLSHFSAQEKVDDLISILTTNQNAAIVIDSDRKTESARINATKTRIKSEFSKIDGLCWITKGKEIENYLPQEGLEHRFSTILPKFGQFTLFPDYIAPYYKNFSTHKVAFSREMIEYITTENSENVLDLKKQIIKLYELIKKWNRDVV